MLPCRALSVYLLQKDDFEKSSEATPRSTLAVAVYGPAGCGGGGGGDVVLQAATLAARPMLFERAQGQEQETIHGDDQYHWNTVNTRYIHHTPDTNAGLCIGLHLGDIYPFFCTN